MQKESEVKRAVLPDMRSEQPACTLMDSVVEFKNFESDAYGNIGMAILNGSPWFIAQDIDNAMSRAGADKIHSCGLKSSAKTVAMHKGKQVHMISCEGLVTLMRNCYAFPEARGMGEWIRRCVIPESMEESYRYVKAIGTSAEGFPVHCRESKKFGKLRAICDNGAIWLYLVDVLRGLRMQSAHYFNKNVPDGEKRKIKFDSIVSFLVSLKGFGMLVEASGKPSATMEFRQWAEGEAIPSLADSFKPEDTVTENASASVASANDDGFIELSDSRFLAPVRFMQDGGDIWFLARDIGKALGKIRRINEKISVSVPEDLKRHIKRPGGLSTLISIRALPMLEKSIRRYNQDAYEWLAGAASNVMTAEAAKVAGADDVVESAATGNVQEDAAVKQAQPVLTSEQVELVVRNITNILQEYIPIMIQDAISEALPALIRNTSVKALNSVLSSDQNKPEGGPQGR